MLSAVEFSKLVSRTTTHVLDPLLIAKYQQIEDPYTFWRCVKELLPKSLQYLDESHPLNTNMSSVLQVDAISPTVYDLFLNHPNPIMVPFLVQDLPQTQKVSIDFLGPLLERFDAHKDPQQWRKNMLLAGRLSLNKQWGRSYTTEDGCLSYALLTDMWKEAYTHLPEEMLFQSSDKRVQFFLSLNEVFPLVQQRFPQNLGKLMNTAMQDCLNIGPNWVSEEHLKTWDGFWNQLSAQHWQDVTLPQQQYAKEIIEPFMRATVQKHTIFQHLTPMDEEGLCKRKM